MPGQPHQPAVAPIAGTGLHDWILEFTRRNLVAGKTPAHVKQRCLELTRGKGRSEGALAREIGDAVDGAKAWLKEHPLAKREKLRLGQTRPAFHWWQGYLEASVQPRIPLAQAWRLPVNERLVKRILSHQSSFRMGERGKRQFDLGDLYAGLNFPLCLTRSVHHPRAQRLRFWQERGHEHMQWMVPNPCLHCGDGGWVKTDENGGERIWLIIEFDQRPLSEQAKLLWWLGQVEPEWELAMIVYSGGKSLHGWFSTVGKNEAKEVFHFFRLATSLGCDRVMRSPVQFTRVPMGENTKTGRVQGVWYWSQNVIDFHNEKLSCSYAKLMK